MTKEKIKILLDGKERELPIIESTIGAPSLEIWVIITILPMILDLPLLLPAHLKSHM